MIVPARGKNRHKKPGSNQRRHWTIVATVLLLIIINVSQFFSFDLWNWMVTVISLLLLTVIAGLGGLSSGQLGLNKKDLVKGLRWGSAAALIIIIALGIVFAVDRSIFIDNRYDNTLRQALLIAFVVIPINTVAVEELAFRGVLWGSIRRWKGALYATILSSFLFGLWHILPSLGLWQSSAAITESLGSNEAIKIVPVIGSVVVTAMTGVFLCELRRRTNSLLAPVMAHWALNACSVILATLA